MDPDELLAEERLGDVINGKWTLERLLGVGGMAAVYAARDREGNVAAVKVLHPEMSRRADIRDRFLREGQTASLVGHPGIVQMHLDETTEGDDVALVMELLDGDSLTGVIDRKGLGTDELLDVLDQVLDALAAAHDKGIVHRDLKPDNLFLTRDGKVKVLDFGIARIAHEVPGRHKTKTGVALGTVPYMAPEQALARHGQVDGRTDLFAIGAIAFRVLTGRYIHVGDTDPELLIAMASKPAPPIRTIAPDVPADLAAIIDLALAFAKDARYPDARTMQKDVRAIRDGRRPPYASSRHATREIATRLDQAAPVFPPPSSSPSSPPANAYAPTEVDLAPPSSSVPPSRTPTEVMPSPPADLTATVKSTGETPPQPPHKKSRWPLALGAVAIAGVSVAAIFIFKEGSSNKGSDVMTVDTSQNVEPASSQPLPPQDTASSDAPSPTASGEIRETAPAVLGGPGTTGAGNQGAPPGTSAPTATETAPAATTGAPTPTATQPTGAPTPTAIQPPAGSAAPTSATPTQTAPVPAPTSEPPKNAPAPAPTPTTTTAPTSTAPKPPATTTSTSSAAPAPTATTESGEGRRKGKKGR